MQKIVPNIWCAGNGEAAADFYVKVFDGAVATVDARYPEDNLPEFQRQLAGAALSISIQIPGPDGSSTKIVLINAGNEFSPNLTISFMLNFDPASCGGVEAARALLDQTWARLGEGGSELMALGEYPFSSRYGWVEDRFGVHWQLIFTDPAGDPRPFVMPALLFGGAVQNRAAEAIKLYTSAFADSAVGLCVPYGEPTGPATAEALMFGEFRVGEQWFVAMDSGVDQQESFNCGVSLEVLCTGQPEIDHLWESFSAVPEAEQCGWLADKFGVSWQIVPDNMGELMQKPGAFDTLMGMHKIVIADF